MSSSNDTLRLDGLPPEVIDQIVDKLPQKLAYLEPLALTSKSFRAPSQRRILSEISLWGLNCTDPERMQGKALLETLAISPVIAQFVKSLILYVPCPDNHHIHHRPQQSFWIWYDTYLPEALTHLCSIKSLELRGPSRNLDASNNISSDIPHELKVALFRMTTTLESIRVVDFPLSFYVSLIQSTSIKALITTRGTGKFDPDNVVGEDGKISVPGEPQRFHQLESLAVVSELDRWQRFAHERAPFDYTHFDLSVLRRLHYTILESSSFGLESEKNLYQILTRCHKCLEELRILPGFWNPVEVNEYLHSGYCPSLNGLPALRHFETYFNAFELSPRPKESLDPYHAEKLEYFQSTALHFSGFFSSAPPSNCIEHITIHLGFSNNTWSAEREMLQKRGTAPELYSGSPSQGVGWSNGTQLFKHEATVVQEAVGNALSDEWAQALGFGAIERILSSEPNFPRLKKVTFVINPGPYDGLGNVSSPSDVHDSRLAMSRQQMFVESNSALARDGKLEMLWHTEHRAIDDVRSWYYDEQ